MNEFIQNRGTILVADDDPAILRLVSTVVEGEGFKAAAAADGKEAYKILRSGIPIMAAIIDVVMPYIHGTDLVKFMSSDERFKHIPVVIMTAEQSARLQSAGIASGASAFLPKPFSNAQLRALLRTFTSKEAGPPK